MSLNEMLPYRLPRLDGRKLIDPHVVIVGAGASIAACRFDKSGKQVPLLKNIHKVLGLTDVLSEYDFTEAEMEDFEFLYSKIHGKPEYLKLQEKLESSVKEYFQKLTIPDEPTYYDYLILSLTKKDAIISFNWDPFLIQAYRRNITVGNLPALIFPHGNVGVGVCYRCNLKGYANCLCPKCMNFLEDMPLLFPIEAKNYTEEFIIQNEWTVAKQVLSTAAGITIYGYGAPGTDKEAVALMRTAYAESQVTDIAPFTIINLPTVEVEQREKWSEFFDSRMFLYCSSFEESLLWANPRVSLETLFDAILQQHPRELEQPFSKFSSLQELQMFAKSISAYDMHL